MDTDRAYITEALRTARRPFNITKFPLKVGPAFRAMVADGSIIIDTVTKPSATRPGRTITYVYAKLSS